MSTTYGRSPGGYLWAIAEPALGIALLTAIFSLGFRTPSLGTNFALFYASGILPFTTFMDVNSKVASSLQFSKSLLEYPRVTFLDAIFARFIVNAMTHILVGYLLFTLILLSFDTRTTLNLSWIIIGYVMSLSLAFGVGVFNCYLMTRFPVWQRTWAIVTRPAFLVSCIFFIYENVPEPYASVLWYNPLIHIVGVMRRGFYSFYEAPYVSLVYVFGLSLFLATAGILLLKRFHREILDQ